MDKKHAVNILGAGVSGLTAALNLAERGFNVVVHEKASGVGSRFSGDFQGLEDWTSDSMEFLRKVGVKKNFYCKEGNTVRVYPPSMKCVRISNEKPFFHLVKRGSLEGSLDYGLRDQAMDCGVEIKYNSKAREEECDIIAAGPDPRRLGAIAVGITFETTMEDSFNILFCDKIAPKGYAYLLVADNKATLAAVLFRNLDNGNVYLEKALHAFEGEFKFEMKNPKRFGGYGSFSLNPVVKDGRLYIGEAAGFQDVLFGFGMKYAMLSGYLAAKSIAEKRDYRSLVECEIMPMQHTSIVNRFLFERLGDRGYELIAKKISRLDAKKELRKHYLPSASKKLVYPLAIQTLRKTLLARR
ncbi:MAG: NAD(P)/FAD-dependent oxidoreductase [Candidatus Altiarchaeales archaeon]|nr:NAD(P)/FAD-dependent oxidoreductase [Candidatus Altiarchaeales archaeon]